MASSRSAYDEKDHKHTRKNSCEINHRNNRMSWIPQEEWDAMSLVERRQAKDQSGWWVSTQKWRAMSVAERREYNDKRSCDEKAQGRRCWVCGYVGHLQYQCWALEENASQRPKDWKPRYDKIKPPKVEQGDSSLTEKISGSHNNNRGPNNGGTTEELRVCKTGKDAVIDLCDSSKNSTTILKDTESDSFKTKNERVLINDSASEQTPVPKCGKRPVPVSEDVQVKKKTTEELLIGNSALQQTSDPNKEQRPHGVSEAVRLYKIPRKSSDDKEETINIDSAASSKNFLAGEEWASRNGDDDEHAQKQKKRNKWSSDSHETKRGKTRESHGPGTSKDVDIRASRRVSADAMELNVAEEDSMIAEERSESTLNESSVEEVELTADSIFLEHDPAPETAKRTIVGSEEAQVKKKARKSVSFAEDIGKHDSASIKNAEFKAAEKLALETKKKWATSSKELKGWVRKKEAAEKTVAEMKKLFADQKDVITPLEKLATETNEAVIAAQKDYAECKEKHTAAEKHVIGIRMLSAVDSKIKTLKSKRDELHELLKDNPHFQALQATMRELKDTQAERTAAVEVVEKCKNKL